MYKYVYGVRYLSLSKRIRAELRRATLYKGRLYNGSYYSGMVYDIKNYPEHLVCSIATNSKGKIIGWACHNAMRNELKVYVLPHYRRRGIGQKLCENMTGKVERWGSVATQFFNSIGA